MPQVTAANLTEQTITQPTAENSNRITFILPYCKVKVHPCTGTEALYRPYGPQEE
jgi:hypothetical protein